MVQYPWHALHGQTLDIERALTAEGERVDVITLADGRLTHLPVWTTEDAAAGPSTLAVRPIVDVAGLAGAPRAAPRHGRVAGLSIRRSRPRRHALD